MKIDKNILIQILIYTVSVWISIKYADGFWVVGPVFGLAVITCDSKLFRDINRDRHISFLIASTLIYALVYWVAMRKWETEIEIINYLISPFPLGIVLGSILLPLAHQVILKKSVVKTKWVTPALIASFYFISLLALLNNEFHIGFRFNFLAVMIALWQGIYLCFFFREGFFSRK